MQEVGRKEKGGHVKVVPALPTYFLLMLILPAESATVAAAKSASSALAVPISIEGTAPVLVGTVEDSVSVGIPFGFVGTALCRPTAATIGRLASAEAVRQRKDSGREKTYRHKR